MKHIFRVPEPLLKFYVCICRVAQQAVESMCRMLIDRSIKSALDQPTLAFLIKELEGMWHRPRTNFIYFYVSFIHRGNIWQTCANNG